MAADEVVLEARGLAGVHEVGAPAHVDDGLRERLVERHEGVAEARDAGLVAERLADRGAEHDARVLDRVVHVDVGVAARRDVEVDERVLGERREHVVEERHGRRDRRAAGAIEVDAQLDARLARLATQFGDAGRALRCAHRFILPSTSRNSVVSSGVPAVTRKWPGRPTSRMRMPCSSRYSKVACGSSTPPNSTKLAPLVWGA